MVVVWNLTNTQSKVIPHQHLKTDIIDFPTNVSEFYNDAWYIDNTVNDLVNYYRKDETYTQTQVDNAISTAVSAVYRYRGSVETFSNLPSSWMVVWDVYDVRTAFDLDGNHYEAGTDVAWNGSAWNPLGGELDLSNYYTKDEIDELIPWQAYTKVEINRMTWLSDALASFDWVTVTEDPTTKQLTATDNLDTDIEDAFEKDAASIKRLVTSFNAVENRVDDVEGDITNIQTAIWNVYTKSEVNTITWLNSASAWYSAVDVAENQTTHMIEYTDYTDNKNIDQAQDKNIAAIKALWNKINNIEGRIETIEAADDEKTKWLSTTFTGSSSTISDSFITPQSVIIPTYSKEPNGAIKLYVDNGTAQVTSTATESNLTVYLCIMKNPLV